MAVKPNDGRKQKEMDMVISYTRSGELFKRRVFKAAASEWVLLPVAECADDFFLDLYFFLFFWTGGGEVVLRWSDDLLCVWMSSGM